MSEGGFIALVFHAVIACLHWGRWGSAILRGRTLGRANIQRLTLGGDGAGRLVAVDCPPPQLRRRGGARLAVPRLVHGLGGGMGRGLCPRVPRRPDEGRRGRTAEHRRGVVHRLVHRRPDPRLQRRELRRRLSASLFAETLLAERALGRVGEGVVIPGASGAAMERKLCRSIPDAPQADGSASDSSSRPTSAPTRLAASASLCPSPRKTPGELSVGAGSAEWRVCSIRVIFFTAGNEVAGYPARQPQGRRAAGARSVLAKLCSSLRPIDELNLY